MDFYKGTIPIVDFDGPATDLSHPPGETFGMVPRDYDEYPEEMFAQPDQMQIIPKTEWDARYDEQEATESSLEHLYLRGGQPAFVNLDQNGDGYCWQYSVGHSVMLTRLKMNMPHVRLNPHSSAAICMKGQDKGAWCGLGAQNVRDLGMDEEGTGPGQWPLHSRNLKHDTPEARAIMAKYKITEDWVDLTKKVYDQNMTNLQIATCSFNNIPTPEDFNWWGHSVCGIRHVRIEAGSWGRLILNSWKGWGRFGLGVLRGSQAIANGSVATRVVTA